MAIRCRTSPGWWTRELSVLWIFPEGKQPVSTCCARPPLSSVAPLFQMNPLNLWQENDVSVTEKIWESDDVFRIISLMGAQSSAGVQELARFSVLR